MVDFESPDANYFSDASYPQTLARLDAFTPVSGNGQGFASAPMAPGFQQNNGAVPGFTPMNSAQPEPQLSLQPNTPHPTELQPQAVERLKQIVAANPQMLPPALRARLGQVMSLESGGPAQQAPAVPPIAATLPSPQAPAEPGREAMSVPGFNPNSQTPYNPQPPQPVRSAAAPLSNSFGRNASTGGFNFGTGELAPVEALRPSIEKTTADLGIDPRYLATTLAVESRGGRNLGSRGNPGQFDRATANAVGIPNAVSDPDASVRATGALAVRNAATLEKGLGRAPTMPEVYLAHQQGAAGALKLLANPDAPAASVLPREHIRQNLPGGMRDQVDTITAGQFADLWKRKWLRHAQGLGYHQEG